MGVQASGILGTPLAPDVWYLPVRRGAEITLFAGEPSAQLPASFMREINTEPVDLLPCV
jgi:hypothetical protein